MLYVTDTNVWYDIAENNIRPEQLINKGVKLYATAINVIEIATNIKKTFVEKKNIIKGIQKYCLDILPEPIEHLSSLFGYSCNCSSPTFCKGYLGEFIKSAYLTQELLNKIKPLKERNEGFHNYSSFLNQFYDSVIPGHSLAEHKREVTTEKDKRLFEEFFRLPEYNFITFKNLQDEVQHWNHNNSTTKSPLIIYPLVEPYIKAKSKYELLCGTRIQSKSNDYADMLHFLYLQAGRKLLTSDKRWLMIAQESGVDNMVLSPTNAFRC